MATVVKLIFRFDYAATFEIMDGLGKILRTIYSHSPDFWQEIGESRANRSVVTRHTDPKVHADGELNIDISAINGTIEMPLGSNWRDAVLQNYLRNCSLACEKIMAEFQITKISRAGIRFFIFDYDDVVRNNSRSAFTALSNKAFLEDFEKSIGEVNDLGLTLEGTTESRVSFRIMAGPGATSDVPRFLPRTANQIPIDAKRVVHQLTADIDLFELNIDFAGLNLERWARTKWPLAEKMVGLVKQKMVDTCHGN